MLHTATNPHTNPHTYTERHTHTRAHTNTHTRTHAHTHAHTHTHCNLISLSKHVYYIHHNTYYKGVNESKQVVLSDSSEQELHIPGKLSHILCICTDLKGTKSQRFGDMCLIELIKCNSFQQHSYF